jgi:hypothetical protein
LAKRSSVNNGKCNNDDTHCCQPLSRLFCNDNARNDANGILLFIDSTILVVDVVGVVVVDKLLLLVLPRVFVSFDIAGDGGVDDDDDGSEEGEAEGDEGRMSIDVN